MGKDSLNIAYNAIQNINFSTADFYNALHESLQPEAIIEAIRNHGQPGQQRYRTPA
jgi:hypothetical protein